MSVNCAVANCNKPRHLGKKYCLEHYKQNSEELQYGIDVEIQKKLKAKWDGQKAAQAQAWAENLVGQRLGNSWSDPAEMLAALRTGEVLCQLANIVRPGSVKNINKMNAPFKHRENIVSYLDACKGLGMLETDLFVAQDLYEGANPVVVLDNLVSFSAHANKINGRIPLLGAKLADKNERNFTEEQLKAGKEMMSRQTVGSYGYQDETKNPSLDRQIVKNPTGLQSSDEATKLSMGGHGIAPEKTDVRHDKIIRNPDDFQKQRGGASSGAHSSGPRFCGKCGKPRVGEAKFCGDCGSPYQ